MIKLLVKENTDVKIREVGASAWKMTTTTVDTTYSMEEVIEMGKEYIVRKSYGVRANYEVAVPEWDITYVVDDEKDVESLPRPCTKYKVRHGSIGYTLKKRGHAYDVVLSSTAKAKDVNLVVGSFITCVNCLMEDILLFKVMSD